MKRFWPVCLFYMLVLCACTAPAPSPAALVTPAVPRVAIDYPAEGSLLLSGPVEVVYHAYAPEGVAALEFGAGETRLEAYQPASGEALVTRRFIWQAESGGYRLWARAANRAGVWSELASVSVNVLARSPVPSASMTPSPTLTATLTPVPSVTATPTASATLPALPTFTPLPSLTPTLTLTRLATHAPAQERASLSEPVYTSDHIYYRSSACGPRLTRVTVNAFHPAGVRLVILVYSTINDRSFISPWQIDKMEEEAPGVYSFVVNGEDLIEFEEAWMQYQVVVYDLGGGETRSILYRNITVSLCQK